MSRSGYTDDGEDGILSLYRANIDRATMGKRGQKFFRELVLALDAMPEKRLVEGELEADGEVCSLGALRRAKGVGDPEALTEAIDCGDYDTLGKTFNIAPMLTQEVMYWNDECGPSKETPEERWHRMRKWAGEQIGSELPAIDSTGEKETENG